MMINTYNGRCHDAGEITGWLRLSGMASTDTFDLDTDTSVIIAVKQKVADPEFNGEIPAIKCTTRPWMQGLSMQQCYLPDVW